MAFSFFFSLSVYFLHSLVLDLSGSFFLGLVCLFDEWEGIDPMEIVVVVVCCYRLSLS